LTGSGGGGSADGVLERGTILNCNFPGGEKKRGKGGRGTRFLPGLHRKGKKETGLVAVQERKLTQRLGKGRDREEKKKKGGKKETNWIL